MHRLLIFILFALTPFLSIKATELVLNPIEAVKTRNKVLFLKEGHVIYFFDDHTIVYLKQLPSESHTWTHCWNYIAQIPQYPPQFYFNLENWNSFSSFQLHSYYWKVIPNSDPLTPPLHNFLISSQYPYVIENTETGEMALCQIWSLSDLGIFISQYGEERYLKGFHARDNIWIN